MIPDFIDDDRANPRPRVRTAQGVGNLRGILRLPSADDVAPEAHAVFGRAEAEAVAVTGQIPVRIGGKEINFLAMRIEPEAARQSRVGVPVILGEDKVAPGLDDRLRRNAEFMRHRPLVGQIPVADVHVHRIRVVQLNGVHLRRVGVRERFVDENPRNVRRWIVRARRAARERAGAPIRSLAPRARRGMFVNHDQRKAEAVGRRIPRVVVIKVQNQLAARPFQRQSFTCIIEAAGIFSSEVRRCAIARSERRQIFDDDKMLPGTEAGHSAAGKGEADAVGEMNAAQVQRRCPDIF